MNQDKTELRRRFSAVRSSLSRDERIAAETAIFKNLFSLPVWENVPLVCGYTATRGEIDLSPVWDKAVSLGKGYALPVTVTGARHGQMIFRRLSGYAPHTLVSGRFGISEPSPSCPALTPVDYEGALILVPGLAFDNKGYRVGYGGGYYDRFLASLAEAGVTVTTVGLVFSACRVQTLPHEAHDRPVDYIIEERSVIRPYEIK